MQWSTPNRCAISCTNNLQLLCKKKCHKFKRRLQTKLVHYSCSKGTQLAIIQKFRLGGDLYILQHKMRIWNEGLGIDSSCFPHAWKNQHFMASMDLRVV